MEKKLHPTAVAFIPARAGSKRVQGKNIRPLQGHPAIAYTIQAALQSQVFEKVIVSTDSEKIADIAKYYGAEVPFLRPTEFAGDASPDIEWIQYTLSNLAQKGEKWDCFSILSPTSPFRQSETLQRAWKTFLNHPQNDSLRAIEKCKEHPGKMWVIQGPQMTPLLLNPKRVPWHSSPYQSLPEVYVQNASLEIAWCRVVTETQSIAGKCLTPFVSEGYEGFDINDELDWFLAEKLIDLGKVKPISIPLLPHSDSL